MHDIVIRGGTIIDGTGKPAFSGDVAIAEGKITGVGGKQILLEDPSGNPVELFEPILPEARLNAPS